MYHCMTLTASMPYAGAESFVLFPQAYAVAAVLPLGWHCDEGVTPGAINTFRVMLLLKKIVQQILQAMELCKAWIPELDHTASRTNSLACGGTGSGLCNVGEAGKHR